MKMSKKGMGKFVAGAAIGAGLGLLFAPKKGSETRKDLKEKTKKVANDIKNIDKEELKNKFDQKVKELKNIFNVYSSNSNSAEYILDSEISKILIDIYNTEKFEIAIKDNIIYIKFWISGLFSSPPLEKDTFDKTTIYKNYKMLYLIFYLSTKLKKEYYKVNNKMFEKYLTFENYSSLIIIEDERPKKCDVSLKYIFYGYISTARQRCVFLLSNLLVLFYLFVQCKLSKQIRFLRKQLHF